VQGFLIAVALRFVILHREKGGNRMKTVDPAVVAGPVTGEDSYFAPLVFSFTDAELALLSQSRRLPSSCKEKDSEEG
jgi:hypothetical protein